MYSYDSGLVENFLQNELLKICIQEFSRWSKLVRTYSTDKHVEKKEVTDGKHEEWNILKAFASKKNSFLELHRYGPFQVSSERLRMWKTRTLRDAELMDQKYLKERHSILGNDLATAHFIVYRGGRVKFIGQPDWIFKDKDDDDFQALPKAFTDGWFLESVDASGLPLRYEAFQNLTGLHELKTLILHDCVNIDDWCVDRISGEFQNTLEHLDLSNCPHVTERALSCFYRFTKLRTLNLKNTVKSRSFEYSCILLEDAFPQLTVEGVSYLNVPEVKGEIT